MRKIYIIGLIFLLNGQLYSQISSFQIENHIDQIIQQGDETENGNYYDLLLYYYDNPLDINKTNTSALAQLGLFSQDQIAEIISHIENTGDFMSINELQVLTTFSLDDIRKVAPFITIRKYENLKNAFKNIFKARSNYATLGYSRVAQKSAGYIDDNYLGSPDRSQIRLRLRNPGHISIGLSAQKDPGELWLTNKLLPTPDYLSGHVFLENQGRVKQLVIGDYKLQYGQGLVLGSGFMVGKNLETVSSVKQSTLGVLPYTSITENSFFRGAGLTLELTKNLNASIFYSNQHLDATVRNDSIIETVSSIRKAGLHRTLSEVNAQNQLHEQVWGSTITYNTKRFSTGILLVNSQFNKPIVPQNRDYNQYKFTGTQLMNYSWFGQYQAGSFILFSEVAKTQNAGSAVNFGIIGSISKHVSLSLLYRSLDTDFHSLYGLSFTESSRLSNEKGLFWGIKIYPISKLTISGYYDMYKFPWITSNTAAPSTGMDYLVRVEYKMDKSTRMFVQVRKEETLFEEKNGNTNNNQPVSLFKSILNFDYLLENPLSFRSRIQYNYYRQNSSDKGWLIYQDINYQRMRFGLTGRILLFETESFGSRQYAYEKDMLFTFNTRVFIGTGISYYLILKYKPLKNLALRAKLSYTEYVNQNNIGSGNDLIQGNLKTQISGQLYYSF